jgi:hypothetical protein
LNLSIDVWRESLPLRWRNATDPQTYEHLRRSPDFAFEFPVGGRQGKT